MYVVTVDAQTAGGALVWATDVMGDQLVMDVRTLTDEETNVAECEGVLWHLEDLPRRYALCYDAQFARRFLVTVIAMTTRFTQGTFTHLSCVTEELALRLLLTEAKVCLETFDLLDDGVEQALDCFADLVYEDMDHEWLYDDNKDGIEVIIRTIGGTVVASADDGIAPAGLCGNPTLHH